MNKDVSIKDVCIIGAGISGLCTIKELLEQNHRVTCYDSSHTIGGAFNAACEGGKAYRTMRLTISNYFMAYSSFPPCLAEERYYWTAQEYIKYLNEYVSYFKLGEHILFNHQVIHINTKAKRPTITVKTDKGLVENKVFDYVVICSGANASEYVPQFSGQETYTGKIIHSSMFDKHNYQGKRVLCIGLGETGSDVCHLIAQQADSCTVAVRNFPSVVRRYAHNHTNDALTTKILGAAGKAGVDWFMKCQAAIKLKFSKRYSKKERYYFELIKHQNGGFSDRFLTKNDAFIEDIVNGQLTLKKTEIKHIEGNKVMFSDGTHDIFDFIVCNTGYKNNFSFVDCSQLLGNVRDLFKHMLHPQLQTKLALIGWARPTQGGVPVMSEIQARYLAQLLSGKKPWLTQQQLNSRIEQDRHYEESFFKNSTWLKSLVDYHQYMREMASLIDCQPGIQLLQNPGLLIKYWYGSHLSYFYRLQGPGSQPDKMKTVIKALPVAQTKRRSVILTLLSLVNFICGVSIVKKANTT
ncbi:NAD(P)-binding domain-containing protein [Endozoicomonas sp. SM1973]|uniref:NAD(P)-binding domain-containing protein n=1 Tax=Spartinivicinus marinus TaxID=2994442 RepID=A0A853I9P0_9GAMM|nr:NAD(P)-binding domain-containing protein [Spartinivicinus marinus]MCX4026870.1 NAD(P)-binding domain-containing protein [Spartinivicinus marinus]NYZ66784.1 NAD(P)-binding domain-containing protein [Spartinivicinus marinus]